MTSLGRLLFPRSIVFIGGSECEVAIEKTRALGFTGQISAVHPRRDTLGGVKCIRSLDELLGVPDAAFIAVKRELAVDVVRQLKAHGTGGAVVYASGFSETGAEGERLQDELLSASRGMPIMGPNCYGFINYMARAALWPDEHGGKPRDSGVAIITQSGNIAVNFTMTRRGLPLAAIVTLGNQADVGVTEMLDFLSEDPRITAIGIHIEGLKNPVKFSAAAVRARARRKPVVVLKTGRSEQGAKVALSHTSSLAGSDAMYDSLFAKYGIARVHSVTAFVETLKFLHHGGPLGGRDIVSMSCSGGEAALIADMAEGRNVRFRPFDARTRLAVASTLNDYVAIDNPLDYHTFIWNDEAKLKATFSAVLRGGYDTTMLILDTPTTPGMSPQTWLVTVDAYRKACHETGARAALVASLPECLPEDVADELSGAGVAPLAGLDDALTAFEQAALIGENWNTGSTASSLAPVLPRDGDVVSLAEYDAKRELARVGITIPRSEICSPGDAIDAARRVGFPVVVKVSSPDIAHKTEQGGVILDLRDEGAVREAAERLSKLSSRLLVERMVEGAVCELIIGVKHDPQFGLAIVIGAGGVLTELLRDTATLLLPLAPGEIERALDGLKVSRLIDGFRGRSGDRSAVIETIRNVARYAEEHASSLLELDVNPLLVLSPGQGVVAVDALITKSAKA